VCAFAESKTSDLACASRVPAWPSGPFGRDDEVFLLYLSRSFTSPRCSRKPPALWSASARLPCCRRFSSRNSVIWDCRWGLFRCPVVAPSVDVVANKSPRSESFRSGSRSFTSSGTRPRTGSRFGSRSRSGSRSGSRSRSCTGSGSRSGSLRFPHAVSFSWTLHSSRRCRSLLVDVTLFS